ncbi:uncharacterized protein LACBIDRAFT_333293 [Laccaria bicolor S238N-H82]|uniref:Predicted protein n=1 Tax=Laccaria bicolor (strain S238N-H82 / ATCC MYA-4686) TaxID=486041 RepID=B0DVH3_LACBS|nr:uncharacterized protein LACBIDRAFT_333293 [Laccaria bicolor S238N-H82]EDR01418.1 predicted protein [Laccaria bicolor S238N-H82]|eukprot:XP_001887963.1 predicted protein [Laccaria bicolor S238N-H82]
MTPSDTVPHATDLLPIFHDMEGAFGNGMRSVVMTIMSAEGESQNTCEYHFAKLWLFILINNNEHLELPHFELRAILEDLKQQPINSTICGLYRTNFPLRKLGELLGETWVGEDVLNGLSELLYFGQAAKSTSPNPPFLCLQTFFFTDARRLHQKHPHLYSQELLDLHQRLFDTNILKISIQVCDGDQYTSYVTSANAVEFNHGDSMHNPPLADALQVFQWVFSDIPGFSQERINTEQVARQGHGNGSDGSFKTDGFCGYNDYNLYSPKINSTTHQVHPQKIIFMKEENINHLSLSDSSDDVKSIPHSNHHIKLPAARTKPQAPLIIDLCPPEMKPTVTLTRGSVVEVKDKVKNIDRLSLSNSGEDMKPIARSSHHIKLLAMPMQPQAPFVIDLCSPEMKPTVTRGSVVEAPGVVQVGSVYPSLEAAQQAIYAQENCLGHVW